MCCGAVVVVVVVRRVGRRRMRRRGGAGGGRDNPLADAKPELVEVFSVLGRDADGAVCAAVVAARGVVSDAEEEGCGCRGQGGEVGLGEVPEALAVLAFDGEAVGLLVDEGCGRGVVRIGEEVEGEGGCHCRVWVNGGSGDDSLIGLVMNE